MKEVKVTMTVKIDVKGPIISNDEQWIYDLFEMDATSPNKVSQMLADANGQDVVVSISSEGDMLNQVHKSIQI